MTMPGCPSPVGRGLRSAPKPVKPAASGVAALPRRRERERVGRASTRSRSWLLLVLALVSLLPVARAEDGYELWLRYKPLPDPAVRAGVAARFQEIVVTRHSPTIDAAVDELRVGFRGLLGADVPVVDHPTASSSLVLETLEGPTVADLHVDGRSLGDEGYVIRSAESDGRRRTFVTAKRDVGLLYGAFALLRQLQVAAPGESLDRSSAPRIQRRLLNHWDTLKGPIERGYAGNSLWDWYQLPEWVEPRLRDYARANASVGINGASLNNVNADSLILTADYLRKVAAIAAVFRPYGIRVYLAVRFSAPIDIGGVKSADPFDPAVAGWWKAKADEIYAAIPDFGGWLVKANAEGEPGPRDYGRSHLDGANMLADALAPHGGVVFWRAFVYDAEVPDDRAKQAFNEFAPKDGKFRPNVVLQVKNGPIDFMPREPFHPLFGAMPRTPLALEVQITQEYLGGAVHAAYLAPLWREVLDADTAAQGPGSTVARIIDGTLDRHETSFIAGVANTGDKRNWTGHPLGAANWYAFGRLAWDHTLSSSRIADEWTKQTFSSDANVVRTIGSLLLASREAVVNYSMPLGLHHLMAEGHHLGPGPWVDGLKRKDWTSVYYHRADAQGIGFDRTATGSNAVAQYAPPVARHFADLASCPENLLLWFHHVPWDYRLRSGRTLWDEICLHYQAGVEAVRGWRSRWTQLDGAIDRERHQHVAALLARQEREAREWRDACTQYFQTFSKRPLPAGVEPPEHPLEYYQAIKLRYVPGSADAR